MATRLVFVHAMTPLHAGTGQSIGGIDLPIARERPTGIPLIPGSSIKGALRARETSDLLRVLFGPPTTEASEGSGAVQLADAHLLLMPIRSLAGTFAWVTSPYLLSRFARDAREVGLVLPAAPKVESTQKALLLGKNLVARLGKEQKVVLEDLDFEPLENAAGLSDYAAAIAAGLDSGEAGNAASETLKQRLCVVHDDVMAYLLETATEVMARIRLDEDQKTVQKGALWYEEALPAESVLVGLALAHSVKHGGRSHEAEDLLAALEHNSRGLVQLGGKATVGRGLCRVYLAGGKAGAA